MSGTATFVTSSDAADMPLDDLAVAGHIGVTTNGSSGNVTLVNTTGMTLLLVTHNTELAQRCSRQLTLYSGTFQ